MTKRRLQLDTGAVFLRLALYFFVLREAYVWLVWMRRRPRTSGRAARVLPLPEMGDTALGSRCPAVRRRGDDLAHLFVRLVVRAAGPLLAHALERRVGRTVPRGGQRTGARFIAGAPSVGGAGRPERWSGPTSGSGSSPRRTMSISGPGPSMRSARSTWNPRRGSPGATSAAGPSGSHCGQPASGSRRRSSVFAVPDPDAVLAWFDRRRASAPSPAAPPIVEPKESLMPADYSVVITDFLEEANIETAVLGDIARITLAGGFNEADLADHLADADALILFHEIGLVGEATFSRAPRCKCIIRAGVGYNNVDRAAAAKHGVILCNVPDYGTEEVADHAIMFLLALARKLLPCDAAIRAGGWDYRHGHRHASAPGQDARRGRLRPDRHGDGPSRQGVRARCRLLRPIVPQGSTRRWVSAASSGSRSCSSRATSSACTATSTRRPTT